MGKVYISYYLRPWSIILYLLIIAIASMFRVMIFPDFDSIYNNIGAFVFTMLLLGWVFYLCALRPLLMFKKFVRNLMPAEKEIFADSLSRYNPNMKFWDSGRFWITNSLTVVDACKIVWLHPVIKNRKHSILIYQYGSPFKPLEYNPAKPLIPIYFPADAAEQITRHILQYSPDLIQGYTRGTVEEMNRKYNAKIPYYPSVNDIVNNEIDIGDFFNTLFGYGVPQAANHAGGGPFDFLVTKQEAAGGCVKRLDYMYECNKCAGSGDKTRRESRLCKDCNGTGRVKKQTHTLLGEVMTSKVCKSCKGRGRIVDVPCGSCKGTGRLIASAEVHIPAGTKHGEIITVSLPGRPGGDMKVKVNVI